MFIATTAIQILTSFTMLVVGGFLDKYIKRLFLSFIFIILIVMAGLMLEMIIWVNKLKQFNNFYASLTYFADSFTTLKSSEQLTHPWYVLVPIITITSILIFAISGTTIFTILTIYLRDNVQKFLPKK